MQRCSAVVLFGVLLLASSGFATSHDRFETRRILTRTARPPGPNQSGQNAKFRSGRKPGSVNAHQTLPLRQNPLSNRPGVRR